MVIKRTDFDDEKSNKGFGIRKSRPFQLDRNQENYKNSQKKSYVEILWSKLLGLDKNDIIDQSIKSSLRYISARMNNDHEQITFFLTAIVMSYDVLKEKFNLNNVIDSKALTQKRVFEYIISFYKPGLKYTDSSLFLKSEKMQELLEKNIRKDTDSNQNIEKTIEKDETKSENPSNNDSSLERFISIEKVRIDTLHFESQQEFDKAVQLVKLTTFRV